MDVKIARFFLDIGIPMLQGYGLSEASPVVSSNILAEHAVGSVGRPLPGVELRIEPLDGHSGPAGEILVRGPNVMAGYFEDEAATDEALRDGWLHTGDIGSVDRRGYLYVVGRIKDVIIGQAGKNVYPAEIEAELENCPLVREACVIGVPAGDTAADGEEVVALIVPQEELVPADADQARQLLAEEIRQACQALAQYKRPKLMAIWPGEFPRTTTMKLRKFAIRKRLGELDLQPI